MNARLSHRRSVILRALIVALFAGWSAPAQTPKGNAPPKKAAQTQAPANAAQSSPAVEKKLTREDVVSEKRDFVRKPNVALVVGVGDYPRESGLSRLNYAADDAEEIARVLKDQGYLVSILKNEKALRGSIRRSLQE